MHDVSPTTMELTGVLWLQPEQRCQAWELWDRVAKTATGQKVTPIAWITPPSSGSVSPVEFLETAPSDMSDRAASNYKRNPQAIKRTADWSLSMSRYRGTPWKAPNKVYEFSVTGLTEEIDDFYNFIKPREADEAVRSLVIRRVRAVVLDKWPDAEVNVFGSSCSGLYLPTSDIDIIVKGCWGGVPPLYDLERELVDRGVANPTTIKVLDKATVPLIKFQDALTNIKVDVAFNQMNCIDSARFVTRCCELFPCLKKLAFVFKQFISGLHLNEVFHGGLSSYSLVLMILSYLQHHPNREMVRDSNVCTGLLLMDLLVYYGMNFDYDTYGIRIRGGGSIVEKSELRESMASHKSASDTAAANNGTGMLSIEDPLAPGNDVARSSFSFSRIRDAFQAAFRTLEPVVHPILSRPLAEASAGESILGRIIRISDAVVENRFRAAQKVAGRPTEIFLNEGSTLMARRRTFSKSMEHIHQEVACLQWPKSGDHSNCISCHQLPQNLQQVASLPGTAQHRRLSGGCEQQRLSDGETSPRANSPVPEEIRMRP